MVLMSTYQRDSWRSKAEAAETFRRSKSYARWDARVFALWIKYGLRGLPTPLYPDQKEGETLTTTKRQEVNSYLRPKFQSSSKSDCPDLDPDIVDTLPFYRAEPTRIFKSLPSVRPDVLYVFGEDSPYSSPIARQEKSTILVSVLGVVGAKRPEK